MGEIHINNAGMVKFNQKNKENFKKLNNYIDNESKDIRLIIASTEMFEYLMASEHAEVVNLLIDGEFDYDGISSLKYKGKRVIRDIWSPAGSIYFVLKSSAITFNVPCICGIYKDEKHP
jgi:hypothetical protein